MPPWTGDEEGGRLDLRLLGRLARFLRPHGGIVLATVALLPVVAAVDLAPPVLLKMAVDRAILPARLHLLWTIALAYVLVVGLKFLLGYVQGLLMNLAGQRVTRDLRRALFGHLNRMALRVYERTPSGTILTRLTSDVEGVGEMFASGIVALLGDVVTLIGIVAVLYVLDWRLALAASAVLPPLVLFSDLLRRKMRKAYREIRTRLAALNTELAEALSGVTAIQAFAREHLSEHEFDARNRAYRDAHVRSIWLDSLFFVTVETLGGVATAAVLGYGGLRVLAGALTLGSLIAFLEYTKRFFAPLRDLSAKYAILQAALASLEKIFDFLDTGRAQPSDLERFEGEALPGPRPLGAAIEFQEVTFAYPKAPQEAALRGVSFRIERGEWVGVVGPTGSGKTTLTRLLTRFHTPQSGRIRVDGVDVRDWPLEALRRAVTVVPQEAFLFSATLGENVWLSTRGEASRAQQALLEAGARNLLARLPEGWATAIREGGSNLSQGERQMVAIARALHRGGEVLLLDEATSHLDPASEDRFQGALERDRGNRTLLAIAHRLSTVRRADRIMVLHRGTLREIGTHEELLGLQGIYWRLWRLAATSLHLQGAGAAPPLGSAPRKPAEPLGPTLP